MNRLFNWVLNLPSKRSGDRKPSFRPRLEALEDRLLMCGDLVVQSLGGLLPGTKSALGSAPIIQAHPTVNSPVMAMQSVQGTTPNGLPPGVHLPPDGGGTGGHPGPILDQTSVAKMYWSQPHQVPTILWLNFDGWYHYDDRLKEAEYAVVASDSTSSSLPAQVAGLVDEVAGLFDNPGHHSHNNISRFESVDGIDQPNRDKDIQDILFRVSEVYAPFNVQVRRILHDGNFDRHDGNTTIFVGHDTDGGGADGMTPSYFSDVAGRHFDLGNGYDSSSFLPYHKPNSDPFDIAFVDRHGEGESALSLSQVIAHEAGHTFGLAHVRTDGLADGLGLGAGTVPDIMSYTDKNQFIANLPFNITNWNNPGGGKPYVHDVSGQPVGSTGGLITSQNSYTYLQTVLGFRTFDGQAHVADAKSVDPSSWPAHTTVPPVAVGGAVISAINGLGEYQVYRLSPAATDESLYISAQSTGTLDPVLMVFDSTGALVQIDNNRAANDHNSVIALPASLSGYVYVDANNDGLFQGTEAPIAGTTVTLTGSNDLGSISAVSVMTDSNGYYAFTGLRHGTYTITETQPAGCLDGKDTIGSQGGSPANDSFSAITLGARVNGVNNNFGELNNTEAPGSTPGGLWGGIHPGIPTPNLYYVVVGGANAVSTGAYVLKVANHAPDPATKIDFQLLAPTTTNSVHFRVLAKVQNVGADAYQGPGTATLYRNNQIAASQTFTSLAPNQQFTLTLDQVWNAPPPPPGGWSPVNGSSVTWQPLSGSSSTPTSTIPPGLSNADIPVYRLQIDVPGFDSTGKLLDGDPVNNTAENRPTNLISAYFNGGTSPVPASGAAHLSAPMSAKVGARSTQALDAFFTLANMDGMSFGRIGAGSPVNHQNPVVTPVPFVVATPTTRSIGAVSKKAAKTTKAIPDWLTGWADPL